MSTDLWGEDLIDDDVLAWGKDEYKVKFDDSGLCEPIKVGRVFEVETKVLNEASNIRQSLSEPQDKCVFRVGWGGSMSLHDLLLLDPDT